MIQLSYLWNSLALFLFDSSMTCWLHPTPRRWCAPAAVGAASGCPRAAAGSTPTGFILRFDRFCHRVRAVRWLARRRPDLEVEKKRRFFFKKMTCHRCGKWECVIFEPFLPRRYFPLPYLAAALPGENFLTSTNSILEKKRKKGGVGVSTPALPPWPQKKEILPPFTKKAPPSLQIRAF